MRDRTSPATLNVYARLAGVGYLLIIVAGIFAEFFVRSRLIVDGDPAATATHILAAETLFRSAIAGEFVMLVCDVGLALALFVIFEGVSRSLALLAAFFRLTHAAVVGVNLLNMYVPLLLLHDDATAQAFEPAQIQALVQVLLEAQGYGYVIGLVFFGVNCAVMGWLIVRSDLVPKILGVLLFAASAGYLTDGLARTLLSDYAAHAALFETAVLVPAFVGELSFCLWLLIKGVRVSPGPGDAAGIGREVPA